MGVNVTPHPEGCLLDLKAQPGARKAEIRGVHDGALKVCVTEVAEKGKANKAILSLLRKTWGLKGSQLEIISGQTASHKRLLIRDLSPQNMLQLLKDCGLKDE
ncbi:DUF167 domain-containing protein [Bremerella sp. P1]|uniref:DUF167 domain-containing protein n=1 Tax=Bremerella sp. P1 TaxID=3026424 RepID=UPI002368259F|nr:DUF167 domain-containing protein [Bremerella sp. P1]WDI41183.1 DUF167 domain-containing protein [Bremerella sp. P1]